MPNTSSSFAVPNGTEPAASNPHEMLRARADQLCRAAAECCRQHERFAHLLRIDADDSELRGVQEVVSVCERLLEEATEAYAKAAARKHPGGDDEAWWHKANALWHASREYIRRYDSCNRATRRVAADHSPDKLGELQVHYALAASALLSLRQSLEGYQKTRPDAR